MLLKQKTLSGVTLSYLGSLSASPLIVVIGRSNYKKSSQSLDALVKELHSAGYSVCWFESRHTQTAKMLDEKFELLWRFKTFGSSMISSSLRKLVKAAILLLHPKKWDYFFSAFINSNQSLANDLKKLLRNLPATDVYLLSHSAGGIVSSLVESEKSVKRLVCFGYPFKHPERDEEEIRTDHLDKLTKPFLIFQGNQDEYGSALDAKRYKLSSSICVVPIQTDHSYDKLSTAEFHRCLELLLNFYS